MSPNPIQQQIWALEAYARAAKVLASAKTAKELIEGVCTGITNQHPYVLSWVGLAESAPDKNVLMAGISGKASEYVQGISISWDADAKNGQGPTGRTIRTGESHVMNDAETDTSFAPWKERAKVHGIRSSASVPIFNNERVIGALMVYASEPDSFGPAELRLFESLANEIGSGLSAIESSALLEAEKKRGELTQQKLLTSLELTIAAMATTMEMRDPYTSGHQRQVATIAVAIAREMGWPEERIQALNMAATIHDIGKISIPSELLTKPSRLTPLEYSLIQEHANNGYLIIKDIPFPWPIADMVRQHHERLDGSGYPQRLKGDEILPEARIIAVADIIDSMSSHRPYRPALGMEKAMQEIISKSGKELDAEVVQAAKALYDRQGTLLSTAATQH